MHRAGNEICSTVTPHLLVEIIIVWRRMAGADTGIFQGGGTVNKSYRKVGVDPKGGGCGRGICPLPREARKLLILSKY